MIPLPIYEILPYLYVGGGAFAIFGIENPVGKIFGFLLVVVGIVVYRARSRYRTQKSEPDARSGRDPVSRRSTTHVRRDPVSRRSMPDRPSSRRL